MSRSDDIRRETAHWARMAVHSHEQAMDICAQIEGLTRAALSCVRQSAEGYNPHGQPTFMNEGWRRLWGMPPAVMETYNMLKDENLHTKETWEAIRQGFSGLAGPTPEVRFCPEEIGMPGRERWTDGYIAPVLDEEEKVARVILLLRDVTDIKMASGEIARLRDQLQDLQSQFEGVTQRLDALANSSGGVQRLIELPSLEILRTAAGRLSERERQIFGMLARDMTVQEIAFDLEIDAKSVYTYRARLMSKLRLASGLQVAAAFAELESLLREVPPSEQDGAGFLTQENGGM